MKAVLHPTPEMRPVRVAPVVTRCPDCGAVTEFGLHVDTARRGCGMEDGT